MTHLFISHSSRDGAAIAQPLASALESAGHRCWIAPRDVKPGAPYPGQIVAAIRDCAGLVLIVTPAANESPDVLQEVQLAGQHRKTLAPVIVGGAKPSDDLHYFIGVRHQIAWSDARGAAAELLRSFPVASQSAGQPALRTDHQLPPSSQFVDAVPNNTLTPWSQTVVVQSYVVWNGELFRGGDRIRIRDVAGKFNASETGSQTVIAGPGQVGTVLGGAEHDAQTAGYSAGGSIQALLVRFDAQRWTLPGFQGHAALGPFEATIHVAYVDILR